jgi:hypothetical protein
MFQTGAANSFVWDFDADTLAGAGISDWWADWQANGNRKIALPVKGGKK